MSYSLIVPPGPMAADCLGYEKIENKNLMAESLKVQW